MRRIEALDPAAIDWFRTRSRTLSEVGRIVGAEQDPVAGARRMAERLKELEEETRRAGSADISKKAEEIAAAWPQGRRYHGLRRARGGRRSALTRPGRPDQVPCGRRGCVVLGGAGDGKAALVASFSKEVTDRDLSAADVIKEAAQVIGGGGGGRENVAQAGGRDPSKLDEALAAARKAIEAKLTT